MSEEKQLSDEEIIKEIIGNHYHEIYTNGNSEGQKEILELIKNERLVNLYSKESVVLMMKDLIREARKQAFIELFKKFDEFACIRDDSWYKQFKKEKLEEGIK